MIFRTLRDRPIMLMAVCFALMFAGFNGAEQYFALYYNQTGEKNAALTTLSIVYVASIIGSFLAPWVLAKIGLKRAMVLSVPLYVALVVSIPARFLPVTYLLAFFVGLAASPLWIASSTYLMKIAEKARVFLRRSCRGPRQSKSLGRVR